MNWIVVTIIAAFFQNLRSSFQKKINNVKKFNLDEESLFIEIESKLFNG